MYIIYIVISATHNIKRDRYASQKLGGQTMNNNSTGIYLGMDVSEKSIELFALSADNKTESKCKIVNNPVKIKAFLAALKNTSRLNVALETRTHSPWLSKMLEVHGCKVFVGHARKLRACYVNSLMLAAEVHCRTVAFPGISTGVYRYPKREAAEIAVRAVRE